MIVAIVGSRSFIGWKTVSDYVNRMDGSDIVISGGANGVDYIAVQAARKRGMGTIEVTPQYFAYGKRAPLVRNEFVVSLAERLVAFWDGKSTGTMHTVGLARKKGIPVEVHTTEPQGGGE